MNNGDKFFEVLKNGVQRMTWINGLILDSVMVYPFIHVIRCT